VYYQFGRFCFNERPVGLVEHEQIMREASAALSALAQPV
jgi:hypothetical protein